MLSAVKEGLCYEDWGCCVLSLMSLLTIYVCFCDFFCDFLCLLKFFSFFLVFVFVFISACGFLFLKLLLVN